MMGHKHPQAQSKIIDSNALRNTELNSLSDYFFEEPITKESWHQCPHFNKEFYSWKGVQK